MDLPIRSRPVPDHKMCAETLLGTYYDPPDPYPTPPGPRNFHRFFRKKFIFGPSYPIQAEQPKSAHGPLQWGGPGRFPTLKCERKHFWVRIMTPQPHIRPPWTQKLSSIFFRKSAFLDLPIPYRLNSPNRPMDPFNGAVQAGSRP